MAFSSFLIVLARGLGIVLSWAIFMRARVCSRPLRVGASLLLGTVAPVGFLALGQDLPAGFVDVGVSRVADLPASFFSEAAALAASRAFFAYSASSDHCCPCRCVAMQ